MTRPFGEGDWVQDADGIRKGEMFAATPAPLFEVLEMRQDPTSPHGKLEWMARLKVVRGIHRARAAGGDDENQWRQVTTGDVALYTLVETVEERVARELMG